jgi:hypothetical protein
LAEEWEEVFDIPELERRALQRDAEWKAEREGKWDALIREKDCCQDKRDRLGTQRDRLVAELRTIIDTARQPSSVVLDLRPSDDQRRRTSGAVARLADFRRLVR